ncbi:MAG: PKD domain-containing protein [Chitinophagales bacterium]|nr:PKD domain-containing protein [Chitinophagales bacterium]
MRTQIKSNVFYSSLILFIATISTLQGLCQTSPDQVSGLSLWLRSDTLVTLDGSNNVSDWADLSGNNNDAYNTVVSQRPAFIDSSMGSFPAIKFDGFDDYFELTSTVSVSDLTFIIVLRPDDFTSEGVIGGESQSYFSFLSPTQVRWSRSGPAYTLNHGGIYTLGDFQIVSTYVDGSSFYTSRNKDVYPTPATPGYPPQNLSELGRIAAGNGRFNGAFVELMLFDSRLPDSTRFSVEDYLINKYAPSVDLPDTIFNTNLCPDTTIRVAGSYNSYAWSTGDTTPSIFVTQAGTYSVTVESTLGIASSDTVVVTGPTSDLPPNSDLCFGDSLFITGDLGAQYNYLWSNGETSANIYAKDNFSYSLEISDTLGCTIYSDTMSITLDSFSAYDLLPLDTAVCEGKEISTFITDSIVSDYNWMNSFNTRTITIYTGGTYFVHLTNLNGCTAVDTSNVLLQGESPVVVIGLDTTCFGDSTNFADLSTINNGNIIDWQWQFGDGNNSNDPDPTHLYNINAVYVASLIVTTDSGCSSQSTKTVILRNPPVAGFSQGIICAGVNADFENLSSQAGNDSIISYLWTVDTLLTSTDENITVAFPTPGDYNVTLSVTSQKGCVSEISDSIEVFSELIPSFDVENTCSGEMAQFSNTTIGGGIVAFFWDFGDGIGTSSLASPSYSYSNTGMYQVSFSITNAIGCSITITDSIDIKTLPVADFENNSVCQDAPVILSDNSSLGSDSIVQWQWFHEGLLISDSNTFTYSFSENGLQEIQLVITTESGCTDDVDKNILVEAKPHAEFSFSPRFGAAPLEVEFTNTSENATTYTWNFGDDNSTFSFFEGEHTYIENGNYTIQLVAVNSSNCSDTFTDLISLSDIAPDLEIVDITHEEASPNSHEISVVFANKGVQVIVSADFTLQLNNGMTVLENWKGILYPGFTETFVFSSKVSLAEFTEVKTFCVEARNINSGTEELLDNNRECLLFTDHVVIHAVYPSPADQYVIVDLIDLADREWYIRVYNSIGHQMGSEISLNSTQGLASEIIKTTTFASGIYYIQVESGDERYVQKFHVKRR